MPIGVSSIIQAKFFQSMFDQQVLNVQYYVITFMETLADDLSDYAEPMFNHWRTCLQPVQSQWLNYVRMELYEVNGLDYAIYAPTPAPQGSQTGEALPIMNAISVQQVRETRATRHGWKRFAGIPEVQSANNRLQASWLDEWQEAVNLLFPDVLVLQSAEFPDTRSINFQPIIWGGNDPDFPLGRYSTIQANVVNDIITTQNTRKLGRGS